MDKEESAKDVGGGEATAEDVADDILKADASAVEKTTDTKDTDADVSDVAVGAEDQKNTDEQNDKIDVGTEEPIINNDNDTTESYTDEIKSDDFDNVKDISNNSLENKSISYEPTVYEIPPATESMVEYLADAILQGKSILDAVINIYDDESLNGVQLIEDIKNALADLEGSMPTADIPENELTPVEKFINDVDSAFKDFTDGTMEKYNAFCDDIGVGEKESISEYLKRMLSGDGGGGADSGLDTGMENNPVSVDMNEAPVPDDIMYDRVDNDVREFTDTIDNNMINEPDPVADDGELIDKPEIPDDIDIPLNDVDSATGTEGTEMDAVGAEETGAAVEGAEAAAVIL